MIDLISTPNKIANAVSDSIDQIGSAIGEITFGKGPRSLIDLETVDSDRNLISRGGSYLSVMRINGGVSLIGTEEFQERGDEICSALANYLGHDRKAHTIKIIYDNDPDGIEAELEQRLLGAKKQSISMGMDISDLTEEKIKVNSKHCHVENTYLCFYTHNTALSQMERQSAIKSMNAEIKEHPSTGDSQPVLSYVKSLCDYHNSCVDSIIRAITKTGLDTCLISSDDVLRNIDSMLNGLSVGRGVVPESIAHGTDAEHRALHNYEKASARVRPSLNKNNPSPRFLQYVNENNNSSIEPILPSSIKEQLGSGDFYPVNNFVVGRNRIYAPVHVTCHAKNPKDFDALVREMKGTPFRICFTLTNDGLSEDFINSVLTGSFSWTSSKNRQIHRAREQLADYKEKRGGCVPAMSIVATTWADCEQYIDHEQKKMTYKTETISARLNHLVGAFSNWGSTRVAPTTPDPLECILSTIPGLIGSHVSKAVAPPLIDVVQMLPISRYRSVWTKGASLYRTDDGIPISYEQFSNKQLASITLVMGPMGSAKSSQMNDLNLSFLTEASDSNDLPYIRGIDFNFSGKGVVDIARDGLSEKEKYRARYVELQNDPKHGYNCFDLALGNRQPLPSHKTQLANYLMTIVAPLKDFKSLKGLCQQVIRLAYEKYSDENHNPTSKKYTRNVSSEVDKAVRKHNIPAHETETPWYSIVDNLMSVGEYHVAGIAQRYAVPTLENIGALATTPDIKMEYDEVIDGKPITELFARSIREAIDAMPFLRGPTAFDVSMSEIVILDLNQMIPSGEDVSESQKNQSAVIFLMAMRLLTADFFTGDQELPHYNKKHREYHRGRIERLKKLRKRFFCDEKHRIKGVPFAGDQVDQMIVEGRKFFVDVMQGSQVFDDFSKKTQELAETIIICGAKTKTSSKAVADHYSLNSSQAEILRNLGGPEPGKGAPALFLFNLRGGKRQALHLYNTVGPLMLAATATEAQDRYVREFLYRVGHGKSGRIAYAKSFPGGSVKPELDRRKTLIEEGLYEIQTDGLLDDIKMDAYNKYLKVA